MLTLNQHPNNMDAAESGDRELSGEWVVLVGRNLSLVNRLFRVEGVEPAVVAWSVIIIPTIMFPKRILNTHK